MSFNELIFDFPQWWLNSRVIGKNCFRIASQINYSRTCLFITTQLSFLFVDQSLNSRLLFHSILVHQETLTEQHLIPFLPEWTMQLYSEKNVCLLSHITLQTNINIQESVTLQLFDHSTSSIKTSIKKWGFFPSVLHLHTDDPLI